MAAAFIPRDLADLDDVAPSAPSDGQLLTWVASTSLWTPRPAPSVPVSSVFGRTGAVVAASGDYSVGQVTGAAADSAVVHLAGAETIGGAKTFSSNPVLGTLTGLLKAASGVLSAAVAGVDYLVSLAIGTTPISGGTSGRVLYDAAGKVGEDAGLAWDPTSRAVNVSNGSTVAKAAVQCFAVGGQILTYFTANNYFNGAANTRFDPTLASWSFVLDNRGTNNAAYLLHSDASGNLTHPFVAWQDGRTLTCNLTFNPAFLVAQHTIIAKDGSTVGLVVQAGATNPLANLQGWRDVNGTVLLAVAADGTIASLKAAGQATPLHRMQGTSSTATARDTGYLDAGFLDNTDATWKGYADLDAADYGGRRKGVRVGSDGTRSTIGFLGASPVSRRSGDVAAGLVSLGLFSSANYSGGSLGPGGGPTDHTEFSAENRDTGTLPAGTPAATHPGGFGLVAASAADGTRPCVGVLPSPIDATVSGLVATSGTIQLDDWTAIVGSATLATRATYFLGTAAGTLTATPPATGGQVVQRVGVAVAPDTLELQIRSPILL